MRGRFVSPQVRMLLSRMDTHSEEFLRPGGLSFGDTAKWDAILHYGEFNAIEIFLIKRKHKKLRRWATQESIMLTILGEHVEPMVKSVNISTSSRFR